MAMHALQRLVTLVVFLGGLVTLMSPAVSATISPGAMATLQEWTAARFHGPDPFFSFTYGGKPSSAFLNSWKREYAERSIDGARKEHVVTYSDPESGLEVRCIAVEYADFPVVEWTLYFANKGTTDTPVIEGIRAIDARFDSGPDDKFTLHRNKGDNCTPDSYQPLTDSLDVGKTLRIANTGGRPTQIEFPYFNLATGRNGIILVLSWAGQWAAEFQRDSAQGLRISGGQERTHFRLHPGEEVRSPLMVLQFYRGDWLDGQNVWRAWMVAHNLPRPAGRLVRPMASVCTGNYYPGLMSNAAQEIAFLTRYIDEGIPFDNWWQDAGWYPCDGVGWPKVGTWEVDPVRFPKGLKEVGDFARAHGAKTTVWFEPERMHPGTWLTEHHPEWVLGGEKGGLFNLGHPEARQWLTDHIDGIITEQGIDVYRQDFNIDPLPFWQGNDAEDRQGITEIYHVMGYFAYWDELLRRHPGMLIDSCASGGRRNDLETLRRAVPLLRSDWYAGPAGQQCHTYGLSLWFPFQGTGVIHEKDEYWTRSSMVAEYTFGPDAAGLDVVDFTRLRRLVNEWRQISDTFFGDFYPLTPYSLAENIWMAWQFDRPDLGCGAVQAFRRAECAYESAWFSLKGLDPSAVYRLTDMDHPDSVTEKSGQLLLDEGLTIEMPTAPHAVILKYEKQP
jgi:alpha-galactosidase